MPNKKRRSRSKTRRHDRDRKSRKSRYRSRTRTPSLSKALNSIVSRLNAIENNSTSSRFVDLNSNPAGSVVSGNSVQIDVPPSTPVRPVVVYNSPNENNTTSVGSRSVSSTAPIDECNVNNELPPPSSLSVGNVVNNADSVPIPQPNDNPRSVFTPAQELIEAIKSINPMRSQNYFVSSFDPSIHDIDDWCKEVERVKFSNGWDDYECLSRVATCLKGDARTWINEWVSNDRTWRNFVKEFRSLCPRRLNYANILYSVMSTNSDKYATYAEYARRTMLRLKVVKGLSEELILQIIIRGINDAQVRAAASNANLTTENIVSFLTIYVKPNCNKPEIRTFGSNKRNMPISSDKKCYTCGQLGHKSFHCSKKTEVTRYA